MTSRRELSFSADGSGARSCDVGIPQGGVLSPILYNIYTSRLILALLPGVRYTMYADDLFLYVKGRVISAARNLLSEALGMVIPWLRSLGFEINIAKCQFSVFTRSRGDLSDLVLAVEDNELPCLGEIKYLGVVLDHRLTWAPHIRMISERAIRAINVIRVLARVIWGVTPSLLLVAYRNLIRSTLEWGSPLFSSAPRGTFRLLDRALYMALRTILGCMRSTPIAILLSEAGEPPLWLRRHLLCNRFIARNFSWRVNPLIPKLKLLSERSALVPCSRSNGSSLFCAYRGLGGLLSTTVRSVRPSYFDWPWRSVAVSIPVDPVSDHDFRSSDDPDRECTGFLARQYPGYDVIFTDGALDTASGRAGCGFCVVGDNLRYSLSLQPFTSVLSAELYAILRAVHYAGRSAMSRVVILTDSMRALTLLGDCMAVSIKNYLVFKIAHLVAGLLDLGRVVRFVWVPGHVRIVGNEVADKVARADGGLPYCIQYGLPYCDLLDPIGRDFEAWVGLLWPYVGTGGASCTRYFSRVTYKSDTPWFSRLSLPRRSICLLTRLRTGHVCTGDHFLRMGWDLEVGFSCGAPLRDLSHILHDCPQLEESRPGYYAFLSGRFPDRRPEGIPIEDLVFDPGPGVVEALAGHLGRCDRVL